MKTHKLVLVVVVMLILLSACSNKEELLTDDFKLNVTGLNMQAFVTGGLMNVVMTGESSMNGFTRDFYFSSENVLNNYTRIDGGIGYNEVMYVDQESATLYAYDGNTFELSIIDRSMTYSPIYTTRFKMSPNEHIKVDGAYYDGFVDYKGSSFISNSKGWIVAEYKGNNWTSQVVPSGIRIYGVNDNAYTLLSTIGGVQLELTAFTFKNELEGFVSAYIPDQQTGYIFGTTDGGSHWTTLTESPHKTKKIVALDDSIVIVECEDGYLRSTDNGSNWDFISLPNYITGTTVDKDGVLYAMETQSGDNHSSYGQLRVSTDKGATWEIADEKRLYGDKLSFFDRQHGIAYSSQILQYTSDGGKNWQLIVFPIQK